MGDVSSNALVGMNCGTALALIRKCIFYFHSKLANITCYCAGFLCALVLGLISCVSIAQFTEVASDLGIVLPQSTSSPSGISCYDFNKDGWDDLTIATNGFGIKTYLNNQGIFLEIYLFNNLEGDFKSVSWIDFDNDGDADFFASSYISTAIFFRNEGSLNFTDISNSISYPIENQRCYSFSWADYDNDTFLDLYMCNYYVLGDIVNWLFHNNGDGTFTEVATLLGVDNGVATTYQASWFDYDLDNDVDLFVTNDRFFVNQTFQNNGDGTFTDVSEATGTGISMEAMGTAWSDFDLDADFDLFIPNTAPGSILFENENGHFEDVAEEYNVQCLGTTSWGSQWLDYNNDMYKDLYVANNDLYDNDQNYFFILQDDGTYSFDYQGGFENDDLRSYCAGTMDIDQNGFADLVVSNVWPSSVSMWLNDGVGGNWLKVGLTGVMSNKDAIGTTAKLYVNGQVLMEQWQCGESFMTQNSQYKIFGCADATHGDSMLVYWPSGWVDKYYDLELNTYYGFVEGETFVDVAENHQVILCEGTSVELTGDLEIEGNWSDGTYAASLIVNESGLYIQEVLHEFGFIHQIVFDVIEFIPGEPTFEITPPTCFGTTNGSAIYQNIQPDFELLTWANGSHENEWNELSEGNYAYLIQFNNGCIINGEVEILQPSQIALSWSADTICHGESTSLNYEVVGGTGQYQIDWNGMNPEFTSEGAYSIVISDENACAAQQNITIIAFESINVVMDVPTACFGESVAIVCSASGGGGIEFNFDFFDENPNELFAGVHNFDVVNERGCSTSAEFMVSEFPEIVISLNVAPVCYGASAQAEYAASGGSGNFIYDFGGADPEALTEGNYSLVVTDENFCSANEVFTVTENPELSITAEIENEAMEDEGSISLDISGGTAPYQFEWNNGQNTHFIQDLSPGIYSCTVTDAVLCQIWQEFEILELSAQEILSSFSIYPVPFDNELNISSSEPLDIFITDAVGCCVYSSTISKIKHTISTEHFSPGVYFLNVKHRVTRLLKL